MKRLRSITCLCVTVGFFFANLPARSFPLEGQQNPDRSGSANQVQAYYYQTVPGRLMGVWPADYSLTNLANLRMRFGFTHVVVIPDSQAYNNARRAGFEPSNIMIDLWDPHRTIDNFPCGFYYRDEPVEHDCYGRNAAGHLYSSTELTAIRDYVHQKRPGSMFVVSGYRRCSHFKIAVDISDAVMYSAYQNWVSPGLSVCHVNVGWGDEYESLWWVSSDDQRSSWTTMRFNYTWKYFMTWVNGTGDEYSNLFGHANYLGLVGIWRWDPVPVDSASLEAYCQIAWQNGWLDRIAYDPLPIQLASFTARVTGNNAVVLQWATLSETNNFGFEVQRRSGSADTFATVPNGFVPGNGTTTNVHEYSFVDSIAGAGKLWYRLKQIDLDGSESFSQIQEVAVLTAVSREIEPAGFLLHPSYPNPFNPTTTISYSTPSTVHVTLKIVDMLGREVATLVDGVEAPGMHMVHWNADGQTSGVYFSRLQAGNAVQTVKLILLR